MNAPSFPPRPAMRTLTPSVLLAALLLAACASDSSPEEEHELGAAASQEIERQVRVIDDPVATRALEAIANPLVDAAGPREFPWRFQLVADTTVNAFALPGGFVYVHAGLVRAAEDPAELAGVLGHEIAHATLRHGSEQARKQQGLGTVITVVCLFTGFCDGGLAQLAINVGASALTARFSRTDELEADSAGILYAARAGSDPRGVIRFFTRLRGERGNEPAILEFFSTHPMEGTRIQAAERMIGPGAPTGAPPAMRQAFDVLKSRVGGGRLPAPSTY